MLDVLSVATRIGGVSEGIHGKIAMSLHKGTELLAVLSCILCIYK